MKGCRLLQDFLMPALRNKTYGDHLKWDPDAPSVFLLRWIHKAKTCWSEREAKVFLAWDRMKNRPKPKSHLDFVNSKQRLRAALRNIKTVQEVKATKGYRRYKILDMDGINPLKDRNQKTAKVKVEEERNNVVSQIADVKSEDPLLPTAVVKNEVKEKKNTKNAEIPPEKYDSRRVQRRVSLRNKKRVVYFEKSDEESEHQERNEESEYEELEQEPESKLVLKFVKQETDANSSNKSRPKRRRTENWRTEISKNTTKNASSYEVSVPVPSTIYSSRCKKDAELQNIDKTSRKIRSPKKNLGNKRERRRKNVVPERDEQEKIKMEDRHSMEKDYFNDGLKREKETVSTKTEEFQRVRDILNKLKISDRCGALDKLNESELEYLEKIVSVEPMNSYKSEIVEENNKETTPVRSVSFSSGTTGMIINYPRIKEEERYAIPPVTEQLPEKIFQSDSDDDNEVDVVKTIKENEFKAPENEMGPYIHSHHSQLGTVLTQDLDTAFESQLPVLSGDLGLEDSDDITVLDDFWGNEGGRSVSLQEMLSSSPTQNRSVVDEAREEQLNLWNNSWSDYEWYPPNLQLPKHEDPLPHYHNPMIGLMDLLQYWTETTPLCGYHTSNRNPRKFHNGI